MRFMFRNFWNSLQSQRGFSLPEIMVGSAILVGVGMAGAMLFKDQTKAQSKVEHDQLLSQFHAQLSKTFSNSQNCNATMNTLGYYNATSVGGSAIAGLYICDTSIATNCRVDLDAAGAIAPAGDAYIKPGDWIDKGSRSRQIWSVSSINITNARNTTGPIKIAVRYQINPRISNRSVVKEILLNLRFTPAGQFRECFNDQESSTNNLQNDVCKLLTPVNSLGESLGTWDEATQSCALRGTPAAPLKNCSAQGLSVEGVSNDMHCKPILEGFNANGKTGAPTATCAAGQRPSVMWNGSQMQVICN